MRWMHKFLTKNTCQALIEIGDDAACLFFEIWYTSVSSTIRSAARGIAIDLLEKYETHLLLPERCKCHACIGKARQPLSDRDLFIQLMYLVRCKEEMDLDAAEMLRAADRLWRDNGFADTGSLLGVAPDGFPGVSDAEWV